MNKFQIENMISEMETKLDETKEAVSWERGPTKDAMMLTIPMLKDQLKIMRAILDHESSTPSTPVEPVVVQTTAQQVVPKPGPMIMKSVDGHEPVLLDWTEKQAQVGAGLYPEHIMFFADLPGDDNGS